MLLSFSVLFRIYWVSWSNLGPSPGRWVAGPSSHPKIHPTQVLAPSDTASALPGALGLLPWSPPK